MKNEIIKSRPRNFFETVDRSYFAKIVDKIREAQVVCDKYERLAITDRRKKHAISKLKAINTEWYSNEQ